jgi:hypothetical protein
MDVTFSYMSCYKAEMRHYMPWNDTLQMRHYMPWNDILQTRHYTSWNEMRHYTVTLYLDHRVSAL